MAGAGTWQPIRLGIGGLPPLILKARLNDAGYQVQISDLTRVWEESLSKEAIVTRASDSGCVIDAGSADDQYHRLLQEIRNSFNREKGTTLNLKPSSNGQNIELDVAAQLPNPWPPFKWKFQLLQLQSQAITVDIVTPLLRQAKGLHDQIEALIGQMGKKDHVIQKVTDELEKVGRDLVEVFPALKRADRKINRRSSQREQLGQYQPGLAEFDEDKWRKALVQENDAQFLSPQTIRVLLDDVRGVEDQPSSGVLSEWWVDFGFTHTTAPTDERNYVSAKTSSYGKADIVGNHGGHSQDESKEEQETRQSTPSTPSTIDGDTSTHTNNDDMGVGDAAIARDDDLRMSPSRDTSQTDGELQHTGRPEVQAPSNGRQAAIRKDHASVSPPAVKKKLGGFRRKDLSKNSRPVDVTDELRAEQQQGQLEHESNEAEGGEISTTSSRAHGAQDLPVAPAGGEASSLESVDEAGKEAREKSEEPPEQKRERLKRELDEKSRAPVRKKRKF